MHPAVDRPALRAVPLPVPSSSQIPANLLSPVVCERWLGARWDRASWIDLGRALGLERAGIPVLGRTPSQHPLDADLVLRDLELTEVELVTHVGELRQGYTEGARLIEWAYCAGSMFPHMPLEDYQAGSLFVERQFIRAGLAGVRAWARGQHDAQERHERGNCSCVITVRCAWSLGLDWRPARAA